RPGVARVEVGPRSVGVPPPVALRLVARSARSIDHLRLPGFDHAPAGGFERGEREHPIARVAVEITGARENAGAVARGGEGRDPRSVENDRVGVVGARAGLRSARRRAAGAPAPAERPRRAIDDRAGADERAEGSSLLADRDPLALDA